MGRVHGAIACFLIGWMMVAQVWAQSGKKDSVEVDTLQRASVDTATTSLPVKTRMKDIVLKGVLTEEGVRFYRSDLFQLSLLQRGRLVTSAYRGMPPGFYQYRFADNDFSNPVIGFWNEQWLPYYRIDNRLHLPGRKTEKLAPLVPQTSSPKTEIIFSQDYVTDLSFVDINFALKFSPTNYIQLGGFNFLGQGSRPDGFSSFKINPYNAQLHYQLNKNWIADAFYWQNRQEFYLAPKRSFQRERMKQVGHQAWIRIQGKLNGRDSLVIVPGYTTVSDNYRIGNDKQRGIDYNVAQIEGQFRRKFSKTTLGLRVKGELFSNQGERFWGERKEADGEVSAFVEKKRGSFQYTLQGGGYYHSETGEHPAGNLRISKQLGEGEQIGIAAFSEPKVVPLLWRTIYHDSIPRYNAEHFINQQGLNLFLKADLFDFLWLQLEPFSMRSIDYPIFIKEDLNWQKETVENYGIRAKGGLNFWRFQVRNDFTYNHNYEEAYAPRINNTATLKTSISLFKGALVVDGILHWHFISNFRTVNFNRLLYQYRVSDEINGPYYIGDARIQANFHQATLFFIWENFLSEDYFIIDNTLEDFLIFRIGVDWIFFD